jgi:hypothetical protein
MPPFRKTSRIVITALAVMHLTACSRTARREEARPPIAEETTEKLRPRPSPKATVRRWLVALSLLAGLITCVQTSLASGLGGDSWQEEVLLHDGRKTTIERSQTYGGRGEIGQDVPVATHTVRFNIADGQTITWTSPFDGEIGPASLRLLAMHVKDGTAYVVAEPNLCLSYNKWGRPNPPYVIFRWQGDSWQRIGLEALPPEFNSMNVSHRIARMWAKDRNGTTLTAAQIQAENATNQPQYRAILREAVAYDPSCIPMVTNGKGLWRAQAWFSGKPNLEACLAGCKRENFDEITCPCNQFFGGNKK